jgi:hypothetical protein
MDDRVVGTVAAAVGFALVAAGIVTYVLPGLRTPVAEPLATGVLVATTGVLLLVAGLTAIAARLDDLALRITTAVGAITLALAVAAPGSLEFGGVLWLALVAVALVGAGAYRTISASR